jgi:RNA polymerase sigma-70 factor (ECF subfamily)
MMTLNADDLTGLLIEWGHGDKAALDRLTPLVYDEIRRIAHRYVQRERDDHTLQTSALVNEAYLRLAGSTNISWQNRAHFYAVTAQVMRRILIDHARRRQYLKHGGEVQRIAFDEAIAETTMTQPRAAELLALNEGLDELAKLDPRKSQVVELRYFGGLNIDETAKVLEVSPMTVRRDWRAAKAWLYKKLKGEK